MMSRLLRMPSPSMVVAMIALFVALGGVGYAATRLPKNSVNSAAIQDLAVKNSKLRTEAVSSRVVRNNSLTGEDIIESTLGTVPRVAGLTTVPLTRVTPNAAATQAAARSAAAAIPLATRGQLTVYAKCFKDTSVNQVRVEVYARTTADGSIFRGLTDLDGGAGNAFLNAATPEVSRRVDVEVAGANAASVNFGTLLAASPDGSSLRAQLFAGAKNGTLSGPAGQGLYGNGDSCIFGGSIFG